MQESIRNQLVNNPLSYRSILTIPRNIRFGLEIELENVDYNRVYTLVRNQIGRNFSVKPDRSLLEGRNAEIATPVLKNERKYWEVLSKMASLLKRLNPTFENCSFQINFDGSLLPTEADRIKFLKLYAYFEDIIYKYSKGASDFYRESLDMYASPIILALKDIIHCENKDRRLLLERFFDNKRYGIVFKTEKDLIEFRTPNGTIDPVLWQNYVTFFYYLLSFVRSNKYNESEINEYIDSYSNLNALGSYENLDSQKAITLSKKLFNKQLDRTYFLHQYLGKAS